MEDANGKIRIWQAATAILGVLLIASIFFGFFNGAADGPGSALGGSAAADSLKCAVGSSGTALSGSEVGGKTVGFINENLLQGQATAKLDGVEDAGNMYLLKLDIGGQKTDAYVSKDGKLLFPQAIDLTKKPQAQQAPDEQTAPADIQKSDKPKVELFVMSHCPYGTQIEKGIIPVVKEIGGNIDFEVKFVNYAMHPSQGEVQEQLNQYCVQKEYNGKYLAYLGKFLEAGNGKDALAAAGLAEADIKGCVEETDRKFNVTKNLEDKSSWASGRFPRFMIYDAENKKYGVQGSPSLVINGQQVQSGRDAQSLLKTICGAFTSKPEGCSTDMSSFGTPAPGFGFGTQGGSATAAGCHSG